MPHDGLTTTPLTSTRRSDQDSYPFYNLRPCPPLGSRPSSTSPRLPKPEPSSPISPFSLLHAPPPQSLPTQFLQGSKGCQIEAQDAASPGTLSKTLGIVPPCHAISVQHGLAQLSKRLCGSVDAQSLRKIMASWNAIISLKIGYVFDCLRYHRRSSAHKRSLSFSRFSVTHIDKLRLRIEDTSSKVLVTGDLNAGKLTFVNALLRREVMPVDQQPCTTAFCEEGVAYNIDDESTFTRGTIPDLEEIVADNEDSQPMLKLYLADTRAPSESLLNNSVVDISLIDAPGLNRDSIKTTAVFARQEEIDVVVFVVSAENHLTLSAKEFLWNASNEKAYLFIVVNKYDQIKNKDKCRRLVLEQIKQLSPRTYEDAEDLVHFVDSAAALQPFTANPAFDDLESALRSFVLVERSKSKLQPVSTYLANLLADIELLAGANAIVADTELAQAQGELERSRPVLEK
ncbi:P-loop containing nucleoside triphosphate hydrolase protein [Infundibulicybe gibba]|nr:P-loop containing nucleoside triphosphate hydrolase protein [Infundibulicybe gibba]KAF8878340.1 P-loop containing nucleoside triphosphate hydrolase protein [Infundibulicybe gibba]